MPHSASMEEGRIPVHILTGFLGVGKTTAVRDLLTRRAESERIAVVVNEYGDLGIDGALLSDCASCVLKEVPGGCVCCTAVADLEASIEEILDLVAPTRLVIEPTGLARPSELVDLFRSRDRFQSRFELRPVITLLDPRQDYRKSYREDASFRDQVDLGDILVVNRCDLATEDEIRAAEAFAASILPAKMAIVRASHGVLPDSVFDTRLPAGESTGRGGTLLPSRNAHAHEGADDYVGHGFQRDPEHLFDVDLLERLLAELLDGSSGVVARAKGIFRTTTGWRVYEIAGGTLSNADTAYRRDSRFDFILKRPAGGDLERIDRQLHEAIVPEGAALLHVETESGILRTWDARQLRRRFPDAVPLGPLLELSGARPEPHWVWLVSEGGFFGSGGPRGPLSNGLVHVADAYRFELSDAGAAGFEDQVDQCREVDGLCAIRLARAPGEEPEEPPVS